MPTNLGFRGQGTHPLAGRLGTARHRPRGSGGFGPVTQFGRQREGDQEVGARQQAVGLLVEPALVLPCWQVGQCRLPHDRPIAWISPQDWQTSSTVPSSPVRHAGDRVQHLLVLPGHGGAEPLEILSAVPPQHVGDSRMGYSSISLLITAIACSWLTVVRWRSDSSSFAASCGRGSA